MVGPAVLQILLHHLRPSDDPTQRESADPWGRGPREFRAKKGAVDLSGRGVETM